MKKNFVIKLTAVMLVLVVLVGLIPAVFAAEDTSSEKTTILACSDFQAEAGNTTGRQQVSAILAAMAKDGITSADGFFACGDYDYDFTDTRGGVTSLKSAVSSVVSENMVFVQGNHDSAVGTNGLSHSGNNDPSHGKYGVFVINEDDYMWYNEREGTIKRTAQLLIEYFNEKIASGYDKPIFVLSHLPLHYNMRTKNEGDATYAQYLVEVLNAAGKRGLNVFFLFGHDHSNGWDDYLGGSSVYMPKGSSLLVAAKSRNRYSPVTIEFTYMNAGYTGYYSNVNGADDALTMSYITITDKDVTIVRYDKNGIHNLKSEGVRNSYKGEGPYRPETEVYPSPQTVALTDITDSTPINHLLKSDTTQKVYRRLNSAEEIKDGGKYLIVYNSSTDRLLLPEVVTKANDEGVERIGFEIEICPDFGGDYVYGDYTEKEWTFVKADKGWYIGTEEGYITFTKTDTYAITATLEKTGSLFTVPGTRDAFTLKSGAYTFNYNARMLFNAFTSDPAHFYLYEYIGYDVTAVGGTASVKNAFVGDTVTLVADPAPEGMLFDGWTVESGSVTLSDANAPEVQFTMPDSGVSLKANYKKIELPETTEPETTAPEPPITTPDTTPSGDGDGSDGTLILVLIVVAVALVGGAVLAFVFVKKKK